MVLINRQRQEEHYKHGKEEDQKWYGVLAGVVQQYHGESGANIYRILNEITRNQKYAFDNRFGFAELLKLALLGCIAFGTIAIAIQLQRIAEMM